MVSPAFAQHYRQRRPHRHSRTCAQTACMRCVAKQRDPSAVHRRIGRVNSAIAALLDGAASIAPGGQPWAGERVLSVGISSCSPARPVPGSRHDARLDLPSARSGRRPVRVGSIRVYPGESFARQRRRSRVAQAIGRKNCGCTSGKMFRTATISVVSDIAIAISGCRALRGAGHGQPLACEVTSANWQPSRSSMSGWSGPLPAGSLAYRAVHPNGCAGAKAAARERQRAISPPARAARC